MQRAQFVVRKVQMYRQVEIDTDGELWYFPFGTMSLAAQMRLYHNKLLGIENQPLYHIGEVFVALSHITEPILDGYGACRLYFLVKLHL